MSSERLESEMEQLKPKNPHYDVCENCKKSMIGWCNNHMQEESMRLKNPSFLSKREQCAAMAMQAHLIANKDEFASVNARDSVMQADALIKALNEKEEG